VNKTIKTRTYKGFTYKIVQIGSKFYAEITGPQSHCTKTRRAEATAEDDAEAFIEKHTQWSDE
jgi:hypothetical protein